MDTQPLLYSGKAPLILTVDDDQDNLELIRHQLSILVECRVVSAMDGCKALLLTRNFCPDLILLDIWMPEMDGLQVIRSLQQDPRTRTIPVIAVTAAATFHDRSIALQAGCVDYICKPYELETLEKAITPYLKALVPLQDKQMLGGT